MTMQARVADSVARPRFYASLLGILAGLALILAVIGVYGILSYMVSQRRQEIGVRIAMGAGAGDIMALVMRHGARLTAIGLGVGLFAALVLTRFLQGMLFGVTATDPVTFVAVPAVMTLVGLLACYAPARRAIRVDPVAVLRGD
jgi:ABC-type antimicrobial peptide transport system permease subunit